MRAKVHCDVIVLKISRVTIQWRCVQIHVLDQSPILAQATFVHILDPGYKLWHLLRPPQNC